MGYLFGYYSFANKSSLGIAGSVGVKAWGRVYGVGRYAYEDLPSYNKVDVNPSYVANNWSAGLRYYVRNDNYSSTHNTVLFFTEAMLGDRRSAPSQPTHWANYTARTAELASAPRSKYIAIWRWARAPAIYSGCSTNNKISGHCKSSTPPLFCNCNSDTCHRMLVPLQPLRLAATGRKCHGAAMQAVRTISIPTAITVGFLLAAATSLGHAETYTGTMATPTVQPEPTFTVAVGPMLGVPIGDHAFENKTGPGLFITGAVNMVDRFSFIARYAVNNTPSQQAAGTAVDRRASTLDAGVRDTAQHFRNSYGGQRHGWQTLFDPTGRAAKHRVGLWVSP